MLYKETTGKGDTSHKANKTLFWVGTKEYKGIILFLFTKYFFIWKAELRRERKNSRDRDFHSLVHYPNSNSQVEARVLLSSRCPVWLQGPCTCLTRCVSREVDESRPTSTWICTYLGCQYPRQWLKSVCQKTGQGIAFTTSRQAVPWALEGSLCYR